MSIDFLIPAYNCEKYLEECINSITQSNNTDYNIIIYNDGSTDNTLNIALKNQKNNKNITIINSKENHGVVHARFELIKKATSEYIFFIDSDDYLIDSSPIFEHANSNKFDLIQFNRKKINAQGVISQLDLQKADTELSKNKFDSLGRWGKDNNITYSIHNKLIRRILFENFLYPESSYPPIFEDLLLNIYLLSQNPTILISSKNTYIYRIEINSLTSNPMKIIDASDLLLSSIKEHFSSIMSKKSLQHLQRNIFEYYIPNKIKQNCLQKDNASDCYRKLFSILSQHKILFNDTRYNAIISRLFSHAILIFEIHNIASIALKSGIDIDEAIYTTIKNTHDFYNKNKVVEQDEPHKKPFWRKLIAQYKKLKKGICTYAFKWRSPYIAIIDYPGRDESQKYLKNKLSLPTIHFDSWDTRLLTKVAIENAALVITSVPYGPLSNLKLKGEVFNCWHGSGAFKRFGKYDAHSSQADHGISDYIICSSNDIRNIYADSMELPVSRVFATGTPRTDIYFNEQELAKYRENFYSRFPQWKDKKIYVYLPTYREFRKKRFFRLGFTIQELNSVLNEDEIVIIKNHPSLLSRINKNKNSKHLYTNISSFGKVWDIDDIDTETLTIVSDVFITDYSSAFFEAMLLNKPLVFYAEDFYSYDRDFYFDYNELPGEKVFTSSPQALISAIRRSSTFTPPQIYEDFKKKYMGQCDGRSTERVINIINNLVK